jgi:flagellar hook-associated protein 1
MSLSSALSVALTGLQTSTTLLQLTANNVANAQTPGYTEKSANLSSTALGGTIGGVEIASYTRATDSILQQSLNTATASASYYSAQNGYMQQVQSILNSNSSNPALSNAAAQFAAAWTQLQASPEDPTVQATVVQAGENFAAQVNNIAAQVGTLQSQVQNDTQSTVSELNSDLTTVASLNQQIASATAGNQPTGDLEDERDVAINQISSITNVSVFQRSQGQVALYTSDGVSLLDGQPQTFTYNGSTITNNSGLDVTNDLTGGSLQAEIQFTATAATPSSSPGVNTIQKLQAQLVDLVGAFTTNSGSPQTFANAYNPSDTPGDDFFTATANDPGTFAVNSALVADPTSLPQDDTASNVANTFATNYNFSDSSAGLSLSSGTPTGLVATILSGFQQAANTISNQSQSATQQQTYYQQSLSNATGVNVDTELVNLTTLQNSYAASAHVISTISQMFNDLMTSISD